jgi:uncharacterized membrane-anchored protein YjiN (DUF445 family)
MAGLDSIAVDYKLNADGFKQGLKEIQDGLMANAKAAKDSAKAQESAFSAAAGSIMSKSQLLRTEKQKLEQQLEAVTVQFGEESAQADKLNQAINKVNIELKEHLLEQRGIATAGATTGRTFALPYADFIRGGQCVGFA